ncbi:hypothetical protein PO909_022795, partial [Leuciscus waleckii]
MELLIRYLFIYLLAILLSLSISSTTNSNHTNAEIEWKGGDGAKRSRVRRQNLNLPDALRLPEKAYALYIFWRLLNEVSNDTNTIRTSTKADKLESMTSEGPKNTDIVFKAEDKPSSAPTQEQRTHSTEITVMASFPTDPSSPDLQKTTKSGDSQLVKQSPRQLQTMQKIPEPSQVTEQLIPDSKTFTIKISSEAVEKPSLDFMHEESTPNDSRAIMSFSTELPPQESQKHTQSGTSRLFTQQSTQHLQRSKQDISEPSQVTEQHIPDFTTLTIKISSKAAEEPSSTTIHERIGHFTGITDTKDSTAMASFPTHSPDSQTTTQSGDSQLVEQLTISKQKITEPSQATEQHIPDSTTFTIKIPSKAVEELSPTTIHDQIAGFTDMTGKTDPTAIMSFSTELPPQESQNNTHSEAPHLFTQQSTQHLQRSKQDISEPSLVTEQHKFDSTTFTIKISSEAVEKPSLDFMHEESTRSTVTNNSTAITSFPTELPPQEPQKHTQSGASRLFTQQSTQHLQRSKQDISEPSQVTEQHIPDSTTLTIKISSKAAEEPSSTIIHERIGHFTSITDTKDSTAMASFPTHSPDSQTTTQSGDSQLVEQFISKQKITEPSQVT